MADIAGLEPVSCGFKSRSPYPYKSSDSSTDRMLGYEPGDVGSIPPLTTIFSIVLTPMPTCHRASMPPRGSAALGPTNQPINSGPDTRYSKLNTLIPSRPLVQLVRTAGS
jgi:hypothetical protein